MHLLLSFLGVMLVQGSRRKEYYFDGLQLPSRNCSRELYSHKDTELLMQTASTSQDNHCDVLCTAEIDYNISQSFAIPIFHNGDKPTNVSWLCGRDETCCKYECCSQDGIPTTDNISSQQLKLLMFLCMLIGSFLGVLVTVKLVDIIDKIWIRRRNQHAKDRVIPPARPETQQTIAAPDSLAPKIAVALRPHSAISINDVAPTINQYRKNQINSEISELILIERVVMEKMISQGQLAESGVQSNDSATEPERQKSG